MKILSFQITLGGLIRMGTLFLCLTALGPYSLRAGETPAPETPAPAAEEESFNNWIDFTIGGVFHNGDKAQFQRRHWIRGDIFGGIEDFHYEQEVGKRGSFKMDGHILPGNEDYLAKIELSYPDVGYIRTGYHQFRTWYDGHGGFFPPNGQFFQLYDNDLSLDRGDVWVELGLRMPNLPEITFRYDHQFRDGKKDSTEWGDTNLTDEFGTRNIVPSFLGLDETRDIFTLDIKQTLGNTDLGLGLRYELSENDNTRNIRRRPGETADRFLTEREQISSDLFSGHVFSETRFGEGVLLTAAYSFTTLDSDISGSRIYGASYDPVFDPLFERRQFRDEGFLDLTGGSQLYQHVAALNLSWTPVKNLVIVPSIRFENQDVNSVSTFIETNVGSDLSAALEELATQSNRSFWNITESLELRYTGIRDWSFYGSGEWLQEDGDLKENEVTVETGLIDIQRETNSTVWVQKYKIGAIWYPMPRLNIATQYYYKARNYDYDHPVDSTSNVPPSGDRYPALIRNQNFETNDFNIRATWRPFSTLTFVSRYDFQLSTIDNRGDFLSEVQSAEITTHIFSESITWTPLARLYIQGTIHYVLSETDTPADQALPGTILDFQNDYWNGNISIGYVINDKTDVQANYFYYRADNYVNNAAFSQPYGAGAEEHAATITLSRKFTRSLRGSLKYGYFSNHDETSGGFNDYEAHLLAASLQFRF